MQSSLFLHGPKSFGVMVQTSHSMPMLRVGQQRATGRSPLMGHLPGNNGAAPERAEICEVEAQGPGGQRLLNAQNSKQLLWS